MHHPLPAACLNESVDTNRTIARCYGFAALWAAERVTNHLQRTAQQLRGEQHCIGWSGLCGGEQHWLVGSLAREAQEAAWGPGREIDEEEMKSGDGGFIAG